MEAEYGTSLLKLSSGMRENYRQQQPEGSSLYSAGSGSGGGNSSGTYIGTSSNNNSSSTPVVAHYKQGTYGEGWNHILEMHERMGNNRLEFSRDLQVVSEELSAIYKETDRSRKQVNMNIPIRDSTRDLLSRGQKKELASYESMYLTKGYHSSHTVCI
jgi:hypothetical protein